jgi:hypothetical protein
MIQTMMRTNAMAIALNDEIKTDDDMPNKTFDQYFILVVKLEKGLLNGLTIARNRLKEAGY